MTRSFSWITLVCFIALPTLGCFYEPIGFYEPPGTLRERQKAGRIEAERERQRVQAEREEELRLETQRTPQEQQEFRDELRKRLGDGALSPEPAAQNEQDTEKDESSAAHAK